MNPFFPHTFSAGLSPGALSRPSGGIAIVQSAAGTTADGSGGLTVNFGVPVTAGNSVIALVSYAIDATPGPIALVGGGAGALSEDVAQFAPGDIFTASVWYIHNATGGETGVFGDFGEPVRTSMQIIEVSGLADAAAESTNTNSGNGDNVSFNTVTPVSAANLIVGIGAYARADENYSSGPSVPFTRLGTGAGGASVWQEVVYAIQSVATPQSGNMSIQTVNENDYATANAAFGGA